jgi:hypothetical protein
VVAVSGASLKGRPRVEYPSNVVRFAQRLHDESYWEPPKIRAALQRRGFSPRIETVRAWVDPAFRESRNELKRRPTKVLGGRIYPWHRRLYRMKELRDANVSYRSIAEVMKLDFPNLDLTGEQVRRILRDETDERTIRWHLWPDGREGKKPFGRPRLAA